jgi:hypothetical protein
LYEDSKRQYDTAVALYEQSKVALTQATSFATTLGNTNLDPAAALKTAAAFAPNPQEYLNRINQPGADPQKIKQVQWFMSVMQQQKNNCVQNHWVIIVSCILQPMVYCRVN